MKQERYRKPNAFTYAVAKLVSVFFNDIRLRNRYVKNELKGIKGPAVVLGNHTSSYDQFIACRACRRRMTYVISDAMYYTLPVGWFFSSLHLIHKQQFFTSLSDIRNMKDVVNNNGILCLYPAGVVPSCGKATKLLSATGKLLKMLGTDTYIIREHGMYLSNPKWQKGIRTGKPETEVFRLFSREDLEALSPEEIYYRTAKALDFNDYEWQEDRLVEYKGGDSTDGLENVLHSCPVCGAHFSIRNEGSSLTCGSCGFTAKADRYGFLESSAEDVAIRHSSSWEAMLHDGLKRKISEDSDFSYSLQAIVKKLDKDQRKFVEIGKGTVSVSRETISIVLEGGEKIYEESTSHFPIIPMIPGRYFDLQDGTTVFRCFPEEKKDAVYVTDMVTCLSELR